MPCTARNAASDGIDQASVQSIEPIVKIEMAKRKSFLRP